jgi:4-aminobutyrate aminotransferase-like enzyme/Ser/Thr protein kinase RdoA (MazF antagonist)
MDIVEEIKFLNPVPPEFTLEQVAGVARQIFGLEGEFISLESERDLNYRFVGTDGSSCIFKISNAREDEDLVDMQIQTMMHMVAQDPNIPIPHVIKTVDGKFYDWCTAENGNRHMVRAISTLSGINISEITRSPALLYDVGCVVARANYALQGFYHPAAGHELLWDIRTIKDIVPFISDVEDISLRKPLEADLNYTIQNILPTLSSMRSQIIHNDANTVNLLCDPDNPSSITGLVDFGDMLHGTLVQDLAVTAASVTHQSKTPLEDMCHVVRGFDDHHPLEDAEINILSHLAIARIAQEFLISVKRIAEDPDTSDYLGGGYESYLATLHTLLSCGHAEMRKQFRRTCRFPVYCPEPNEKLDVTNNKVNLLNRRKAFLGTELELSYDDPIHVVRSQGVWVTDAEGIRHLDAYNNVPHVGHCHPHVVKTISRQLATMNSNTRYLYDNVVDYAERLGATMPGDLNSCIFVNSGSESNDASIQIAKRITGNSGIIIVEDAYHGITESIYGLSPSIHLGGEAELPANVRTIAAPNNPSVNYLESIDKALASLKEAGMAPAAFMVDCSLSSNGIADIPADYLPVISEKVRKAGGLIIADEVQIGFGRSGTHMWGVEAQGVVPDIITLGKPMGNGIAIGALVTTPDIHHNFATQTDFFSTFGGNPVACAAAGAVLDVLERENLMENARVCGEYLRSGLRKLGEQYPQVASVSGQGFFNGVEIAKADGSGTPDEDLTRAIVNFMRDNGVLISTATSHSLKIRPSMVFQQEHADILIETFGRALNNLTGK